MNARPTSVLASRGGCIAVVLLFCISMQGHADDKFIIVNSGRPVADAVIQLMQRHPVVITYEDAHYTYAGDLRDVTDEIRNPQAPPRLDGPRIRVPVGGQIEVRYAVSAETNKPANLRETLETVVQSKAALPAGAHFRVEQSGSVFHVVASEVRDPSGRWIERKSVLDVPITLKSGELSGYEMVGAILDQITAKSGVKFGVTAIPVDEILANYRGVVEASDEPARDVLLRTLHAMYGRLTWLLYYDALTESFFFNIVAASSEPTIEIRGEPVLPPRPGDRSPAGPPVGFKGSAPTRN